MDEEVVLRLLVALVLRHRAEEAEVRGDESVARLHIREFELVLQAEREKAHVGDPGFPRR